MACFSSVQIFGQILSHSKYSVCSALRLRTCMSKRDLQDHKLLWNHLFSASVNAEGMCSAYEVFNRLSNKRKTSWYSVINGYIQCNELEMALATYKNMAEEGHNFSDESILVRLLKSCACLKDAKTGVQIHVMILWHGLLNKNCFLGNALVDMYFKCGMLAKAQEVFDKLPIWDVVTWNTLITGYVQHGHEQQALNCFAEMHVHGIFPDIVTCICVLKACGRVKDVQSGRDIHAYIKSRRLLEKNISIGNALIDMYGKCGSLTEAKEVFDALPVTNIVSWTALITAFLNHECNEEALHYYDQMCFQKLVPDETLLVCILKACGAVQCAIKGLEIHMHVEKVGLLSNVIIGTAIVAMYGKCGMLCAARNTFKNLPVHNTVSWNALIAGCVQHNKEEEALDHFRKMQLHGICPDAVTLTCCLKACSAMGAFETGKEIHSDVERWGHLSLNQQAGNAVIDMYTKCGMIADARGVFSRLRVRNVVSWNILIAGYAHGGEIEDVLHILEAMWEEGIRPSSVTLLTVLNACSHVGQVDKGETYFDIMTKVYGVTPTVKHQGCLVDLLGRAGQLEMAAHAVNEIPSHPNIVIWLTVLGACVKWSAVHIGRNVFQQAMCLSGNDSVAYKCMHRIYANACTIENRIT